MAEITQHFIDTLRKQYLESIEILRKSEELIKASEKEIAHETDYKKRCVELEAELEEKRQSISKFQEREECYKNEILSLKDKNERLKEENSKVRVISTKTKIAKEQDESDIQEKSPWGKKLTTGEIIELIRYSGIKDSKSAQEWATVLHLISGCSPNTLRQNFNKTGLITEGHLEKIKHLYDTTLEEVKAT